MNQSLQHVTGIKHIISNEIKSYYPPPTEALTLQSDSAQHDGGFR